jgi:hypothetical protein
VVVGMRFAGRWGVRVVVKGTGHDYLGRWVHLSLLEVVMFCLPESLS